MQPPQPGFNPATCGSAAEYLSHYRPPRRGLEQTERPPGRPPLPRRPSPSCPPLWSILSKDRTCPPRNSRTNPGSRQASAPKSNAAQPCALPTAATKPTTTPASLPSSKRVNTSPPQHRRRAPLPRLPADTIHIVGRPKSPVELTKLQPWHLYTALLQAAFLQDLPPASRDTVRIHPVNNTFTLSVADSARAQAYLRITSLTVSGNTFTVHLYAPPPDDALRGILYHAFDDFTDQAILEDLQASNPTLSVVGGRRMGKAPHILVTLMEPKLPRWIFYHGVQLRLLPFRNKVEACYNCRSTGHRTDVCPKPRQERCHRCGAAHPTPPEGSPPTCNPAASSAMGITPRTVPTVNTATCSALNARRPRHLTHTPRHNSLFRPQR
ncbi:hypothetical protein HPB51_028376 [Rhipicephalus microplus]|uniref:CCHC-type domain-containing protein n=1 Tax=Rhipicephalus microplus TaxID=6941 RepID=A0A9J6CXY4_RHIMP|nr:hypothetical protein HPB51_028376 [Rhipicephalus microplus]